MNKMVTGIVGIASALVLMSAVTASAEYQTENVSSDLEETTASETLFVDVNEEQSGYYPFSTAAYDEITSPQSTTGTLAFSTTESTATEATTESVDVATPITELEESVNVATPITELEESVDVATPTTELEAKNGGTSSGKTTVKTTKVVKKTVSNCPKTGYATAGIGVAAAIAIVVGVILGTVKKHKS